MKKIYTSLLFDIFKMHFTDPQNWNKHNYDTSEDKVKIPHIKIF